MKYIKTFENFLNEKNLSKSSVELSDLKVGKKIKFKNPIKVDSNMFDRNEFSYWANRQDDKAISIELDKISGSTYVVYVESDFFKKEFKLYTNQKDLKEFLKKS